MLLTDDFFWLSCSLVLNIACYFCKQVVVIFLKAFEGFMSNHNNGNTLLVYITLIGGVNHPGRW